MEDIDKRLKDTSTACQDALDSWLKDKKDLKNRSALQESVHELRKVASRIEIELAISERDDLGQKPIPIPAHRDSGKGNKNDNRGNRAPKEGGHGNKGKKPQPKKAAGGEG